MRDGFYMYFVQTRLVKATICLIAILAVSYVALVRGAYGIEASKSARAIEGIQLTSAQATEMTQTADAVRVLIADTVLPAPSSAIDNTGVTTKNRQPVEVDARYASRLENLMRSWKPRYESAIDDITRFEHRFRTAEDRLREYFEEQSNITESINDPVLREELRTRDAVERAAYSRWMKEGRGLLAHAREMRHDLDDMDAVIRKQELTVNMLSQYSMANTIPSSVRSLHESLSEFRKQSDELTRDMTDQLFNK